MCSSHVKKLEINLNLRNDQVQTSFNNNIVNNLDYDKDEHIILKLLNELSKMVDINGIRNYLNELISKPDFQLSKDILNRVDRNQYLLKSFLQIISESYTLSTESFKIVELNITDVTLHYYVRDVQSFNLTTNLPIEYYLTNKSKEQIKTEEQNFKPIEWKVNQSELFPNNISAMDLVIFKDDIDLWSLNTELNLIYVYDCLVDRGFLLSIFRYQLTEAEIVLNQLLGKTSPNNIDLKNRINDYTNAAQSVGFVLIGRKSDSIGMTMLFRKVVIPPKIPKKRQYY